MRATSAEIIVFVDSDSMPEPRRGQAARPGIRRSPKVGAASGLTMVRNANENALTRMQQARYYVSFQLLKSAESVVGAVACNPGCFSAYRRSAVLDGARTAGSTSASSASSAPSATTGRSPTWCCARAGSAAYHAGAVAWTDVPEGYRKFFRQQLRWKKSWLREGPILMSHIWRTRPLAFPAVLIQTSPGC